MIRSFKSKALRDLFEKASAAGLNPQWKKRLQIRLATLDDAQDIDDMNVVGWRLYALKGDLKGFYAVDVTANVRLLFKFAEGEASDVDLLDYH